MINNIHIKKGMWRFLLLVPAITILFTIFCFAYIQPNPPEAPLDAPVSIVQEDTLVVEFIDPYDVPDGTEVLLYKKTVIIVLMNKDSKVMIAREELPLESVEQKIISEYNQRIEENKDLNPGDYRENASFETKIYLSKDRAADNIEYQKLVDAISTALFKLRDMHSVRLYGGLFNSLTETEKETVATLIPLRIYGQPPKNMTGLGM
jgi:hypothetical protein